MRRDQLAHVLRAAATITKDNDILVIGSNAILGSFDEDDLPAETTLSIEVDIAFFDDPDEIKSDLVDGNIGEDSMFHATYGVYGQGVGLTTAVLPDGWRARLVVFEPTAAAPSRALCLEAHDLVVSKLVAGREKDYTFALALLRSGLVQAELLCARAETLAAIPAVRRRVISWVQRNATRDPTDPS